MRLSQADNKPAPSLAEENLYLLIFARTLMLWEVAAPHAKLLFNEILSLFSMGIPDMVS